MCFLWDRNRGFLKWVLGFIRISFQGKNSDFSNIVFRGNYREILKLVLRDVFVSDFFKNIFKILLKRLLWIFLINLSSFEY